MVTRQLEAYELSNSPITDLSALGESEHISSDAYFLISQPNPETIQKFVSERLSYDRMRGQISSDLGIGTISDLVEQIYREYIPYLSSVIHVSVSIPTHHAGMPYVISSMTEYKGVVSSIEGYYLYDGMDSVFHTENFDQISVTLPISPVFMDGYSASNQLAHRDFVNSSIENAAASYITRVVSQTNGKVTSSRPFNTYSELSSSTLNQMCKDGRVCGQGSVLDKNDYCYVLSDETHTDTPYGKENPMTTRYRYVGLSSDQYSANNWTYMYHVNNSPFTDAQWKMINGKTLASQEQFGIVKIGSGIGVNDGVISVESGNDHIMCTKDQYDNWMLGIGGSINEKKIYCISDDNEESHASEHVLCTKEQFLKWKAGQEGGIDDNKIYCISDDNGFEYSQLSSASPNIAVQRDENNNYAISSNALYSILSGNTTYTGDNVQLSVETWYFTLENNTTVPKRVILM